jgi:hypothetical protein
MIPVRCQYVCSFHVRKKMSTLCMLHGEAREHRIRTNDGILCKKDDKKEKQLSELPPTFLRPGRCKHGDHHPRKDREKED